MRRAAVISLALALAVGGCGGHKRTIPHARGESFLTQLDKIGSQFDNGACRGAHAKVQSLEAQATALPSSVDPEVKRNLVDGIDRLNRLVARDCRRPTRTNTTTTPTVTTPTETTTTPTVTIPAPTTTAPAPTSTTPAPTTTSPSGGGVTVPSNPTGAVPPGADGAATGQGSGTGAAGAATGRGSATSGRGGG